MQTFKFSFSKCALVFCQRLLWSVLHFSCNLSNQPWWNNVSVYTSKECSTCCLFFCTSQSLLIALSPLNLPLLKTDQDCTCQAWLELLAFFPHVHSVETVVSLKTLKIKSQKGESLRNDFLLISLPNIKTQRCLFIFSLSFSIFRLFTCKDVWCCFVQRLTNGCLSRLECKQL